MSDSAEQNLEEIRNWLATRQKAAHDAMPTVPACTTGPSPDMSRQPLALRSERPTRSGIAAIVGTTALVASGVSLGVTFLMQGGIPTPPIQFVPVTKEFDPARTASEDTLKTEAARPLARASLPTSIPAPERGHGANLPKDRAPAQSLLNVPSMPPVTGALQSMGETPTQASIPPAPAEPAAMPPPSDLDTNEAAQQALIRQGERLLKTGNIAEARLFFERAANAGNGEAAVLLGDTYDPDRLAAMEAVGIIGDPLLSERWWARADVLGAASAKSRLVEKFERSPAP